MNTIVIKDVSKSFRIYSNKNQTLKERFIFKSHNKYKVHTVLKNISLQIESGEAIGIIGHNGCGKSTLLKLMSKIIYPDFGTIIMKGRVSSLLELGAGFHPDMTGIENIYINASIFGLTKREIDSRLSAIIDFADLGEYIYSPVKTYSSGMYMRLAFSVAINVNAQILLIDEILSVGDITFQEKCFNKLKEIKKSGTTIVIVSHSLSQIESICDKSVWLNDGKIVTIGKPIEVHSQYLQYMQKRGK